MLLHIPFPALILGAGLAGWISVRAGLGWFPLPKTPQAEDGSDGSHAPAILDDHTPTPAHAEVNARRLALYALVFALLQFGPLVALIGWRGWDDTFARMGRFFTLAAFVTVGGAYAVLPYVAHMSTNVYKWLRPGQMLDGLALGETTPGPLILVLTFVGFVGGWNQTYAELGAAGALLGAAIATYFTFLPSFMFILIGAPFVERMRGELRIGAVLAAVSASVAGVISHMALTFGAHLVVPKGVSGEWNIAALVMTLLAFALLQWRKWETLLVIGVCGATGWLLQTAGVAQ
jgi:chromate transporter